MAQLGTEQRPIRISVKSEKAAAKYLGFCQKNHWIATVRIAPNEPEAISELSKRLHPRIFGTKRNDTKPKNPCPCGSGKKYKQCCQYEI